MLQLILAVAFFVGIHVFVSATPLRQTITARIGDKVYVILFGLSAFAGLVWMVWAYRHAPYHELWGQVYHFRIIALVGMLFALFFAVLALISPAPAAMRRRNAVSDFESARGVFRITRYPLLIGVALWAFVHLLFNGDLASTIFFGGFLLLAVGEIRGIESRQREMHLEAWPRFVAETSIVPLLAVMQGRNRVSFREIGIWRMLVIVLIYAGLLHGHPHLFGVSPLAGSIW